MIRKMSHEALAENRRHTTRAGASLFMNRFRKLGFIDYNGGLEVRSTLLEVVLHD
jgi:CRP/FNR family cyclic AMP-dependent transcriptional regulator